MGDQAPLRLHLAALPAWSVLQLVELVGHYAYQSEGCRHPGACGLCEDLPGHGAGAGRRLGQLFVAPFLAVRAPRTLDIEPTGSLATGFMLSLTLPAVGWLLFGIAALRARVYPPAATMILIIGAIVGFLPLLLTELVLNAAVAWLSPTLLWVRGAAAAPTTAEAQPRVYCVLRDYLSRTIVTGP